VKRLCWLSPAHGHVRQPHGQRDRNAHPQPPHPRPAPDGSHLTVHTAHPRTRLPCFDA
jgi:hypothetical protein